MIAKEATPTPASAAAAQGGDWLTWLAFIFVVFLGGSNAVAVRISYAEMPPFWGGALRFAVASLLFWLVVLIRQIAVPKGRNLTGVLIFGGLSFGVSYILLYWALVYVPAGMVMIILALGPLFTFLLAWLHKQESFRWVGLIGALVAFAGIVIGVGGDIGTEIPLPRLIAVFLAAVSTSEATVLFKNYPGNHPVAVNAVGLTEGAIMLGVMSLVAGEGWLLPSTQPVWLAMTYLILGGSFIMFYLFLYVLQRRTASATSYLFLLFPVATIFIAALLTDEAISPRFLIGAAIVLVGVWAGAILRPASADKG